MNPIMVNPNFASIKALRVLTIISISLLFGSMQVVAPMHSYLISTPIIQAADDIMDKVIGLAVGLFATAYLIPPAVLAIADANLTGVDSGVVSIVQVVLPIMAGIALVLLFVRSVRK